jgi:hypothetical protein
MNWRMMQLRGGVLLYAGSIEVGKYFQQLRNFQFLKQVCSGGNYCHLLLVEKCFYAVNNVNVCHLNHAADFDCT